MDAYWWRSYPAEPGREPDIQDTLGEEFGTSRRCCRMCGCTDERACVDEDGIPCAWAEPDLCTSCVESFEIARYRCTLCDKTELLELQEVAGELLEPVETGICDCGVVMERE